MYSSFVFAAIAVSYLRHIGFDWIDAAFVAMVIGLIGSVSSMLIQIRRRRVDWGNVVRPILIADHATFGRDAYKLIPEYLSDNVIRFVPARKVRQVEAEIQRQLTDAENRYYLWPDDGQPKLKVMVRFFRDPKFGDVGESAEEYFDELFRNLKIENQSFLSEVREQSTDADYERLMFAGHRNGSAWNE